MSALPIVCDNCGAKYRLPESFAGDKAKCKQCGSVIDVAAQRPAAGKSEPSKSAPAAAAPAAARPAAARPATARPAEARPARAERGERAAKTETPTREGRASRRERGGAEAAADAASSGSSGGRRSRGARGEGGESEPKKSNTMLLVGGGIGALAVIAVIVILAMGKGDKPAENDQANTPAAGTNKGDPAKPEAGKPAEAAAQPGAGAPADAPAKPADKPSDKPAEPAKPSDTPAQPTDSSKPVETPPPAGGDDPSGPGTEPWMKNKTRLMSDVFDPKTLGPVEWPATTPAGLKEKITGLVDAIVDGGTAGIRAKTELEGIGYYALFGLIQKLRDLDYKSSEEEMTAWEINKLIDSMTAGLNCGFAAVNAGEDLDPRKADHNAKTAKAWDQLLHKYADEEAFKKGVADRRKKGEKK